MGNWTLDPLHTQVEFSAKHFGMMTVRGHFADVATESHIDPDHPEESWVRATMQTASIRTHNAQRDGDLRSANFLDAENYPTITFQSTRVDPKTDDTFTLTGDLTIKGVTRPVTLDVVRYGAVDAAMMGRRISYGARGTLRRKDFGVGSTFILDGRLVVGEEVEITIEGELVEVQEPTEAAAGA